MKKELIVVQRNSFIRGDFSNLEIRDIKILKLLVSKVNATGDKFNDYYYITKDEVRLFQFNERNIHNYIKTSLRRLSSVFIVVKNDEKEEVEISLVGKIIYDKKNGIYKVPLSPDLKEYLLDIKKEFTKYNLSNLVYLTRKEQLKLYEYLKSISFEVFVISIENLKVIMEINKKSFESFFNFHKKLKETISTINEATDISVKFKIVKENNQSKNVQFTIKRFETKTLISNTLTIESLKNDYLDKVILLNNDKFIVQDIKYDSTQLLVLAFSDKLKLLGKLKFDTLGSCQKYLQEQN
ncbi:MAG: replication initiation protein [Arcobacteraceae bacterium]